PFVGKSTRLVHQPTRVERNSFRSLFRWFHMSEQIDGRGTNGMNSVLRWSTCKPALPSSAPGSARELRVGEGSAGCLLDMIHGMPPCPEHFSSRRALGREI